MADIKKEYFEWMFKLMCGRRQQCYRRLLSLLHDIEFTYSIPLDSNRAQDGIDLRYRFIYERRYIKSVAKSLEGPCSVLEMMIALAIRCEEHIMDDPDIGNRTSQWFWEMINSLGLEDMIDKDFDEDFVRSKVDIFLNREYEPNGEGGLFIVDRCDYDLRTIEIWYQMCWHLNDIL